MPVLKMLAQIASVQGVLYMSPEQLDAIEFNVKLPE